MKGNFLIKVPGLKPEEQKRFIFTNLKDNINRLKLTGLAFILIEATMLGWILARGVFMSGETIDTTLIILYTSIILFISLFILTLVYLGKNIRLNRMTFMRIFIITGMMMVLIWGVILVLLQHDSGFLPSAYILIMMTIAVVPYLSFWEIALTMIPSQAFLTFYVLTYNVFESGISEDILLDSWSFCLIAIVISSLFYQFRISAFKTDLKLMEQNDQLKRHSEIDGLTGIYNRRKLDEDIEDEWQRSGRSGKPLSFMLIDLDHFKKFNDTYGHVEGDLCLHKAAAIMSEALKRSTDNIYRYGGEEFAVVLPFTSLDAAKIVAEKLKKNIENARIIHEHSVTGFLTVSIGISSDTGNPDIGYEQLMLDADKALYAAKKSGRNKVICYDG